MKIYKTQLEVDKDIKDGMLVVNDSVCFEVAIRIEAGIKVAGDIKAWDIDAGDINAWDIDARNINAWNIDAENINARDINARNINAWDIDAWDINAWNIDAWNINARNIDAWDIIYWAFCCVINSIFCLSIKAKRGKHSKPICLDGKVKVKEREGGK